MATPRTKQEIRNFLNAQVGNMVNPKAGIYNGQCVSLIKALMEFLGLPDPYGARGNAISVNDTLLRQGLADNGKGWLTIVVNRDMGRIYENGRWNNYGHIWIDLAGEANYEQNGARALHTTKNTRPISQGQQFVNFDRYIKADKPQPPKEEKKVVNKSVSDALYLFYLGKPTSEWGMANAVGKMTAEELQNHLLSSDALKEKVEESKSGKLQAQNHLPFKLRSVYKAPGAPETKKLDPGIYEVK